MNQTCPRRMNEIGPWEWREDIDRWISDRCSFCGSLEPNEFMRRVREGDEIVPTDKNFKAYVGPGHEQFYYQHLSDEQKQELIALTNTGGIRFGFPGYWYVLPYFIAAK